MTLRKTFQLMILSSAITLTACKEFDGNMTVQSALKLNELGSVVQIPTGQYHAKIIVSSKKLIKIDIDVANERHEFAFKTRQDLSKLNSGDKIEILSQNSGQPVDLIGRFEIRSEDSSSQKGIESCVYSVREYDCWEENIPEVCQTVTECNPSNPAQCKERTKCEGGGTRRVCGDHLVDHFGHRDVEFYTTTTRKGLEMKMVEPSQSQALAVFGSLEIKTNTHYISEGICE